MIIMKKVSIIVAVYNVQDYLPKCIDSILAQHYENIELILVNDGSTDRSFSICEDYAHRDSRIKVISQQNGGLSAARNHGIELAAGDYLVFVDGDDWLQENFLERMVAVHEETGSDVTVCNYMRFNQQKSTFLMYIRPEDTYVKTYTPNEWCRDLYEHVHGRVCSVTAWGKIYNRRLFDKLRYPVGKIAEDNYTTYFTYLQSDRITYVNEALYVWRMNPNSITGTNKPTDLTPLSCLEEEFTLMTLIGLDTTEFRRFFINRLRFLKDTTLSDGRYDEYRHICLMLDILKKYGIEP